MIGANETIPYISDIKIKFMELIETLKAENELWNINYKEISAQQ